MRIKKTEKELGILHGIRAKQASAVTLRLFESLLSLVSLLGLGVHASAPFFCLKTCFPLLFVGIRINR
jgi:hypothetical protein